MTIIKLALLCGLLSTSLFAQTNQVEGQGRFQSTEDDSVTFIRTQLIADAVRQVVDKELQAMGLNSNGFFQKLDKRFEDAFLSVHEDLKNKYKIDSGETVSVRQKQAFDRELRQRRLAMRAQFGSLARAVTSYSIKNQSRSTQGTSTRFMTINARVDRRILNSIYSDFMREGRARFFQSLLVSVNLELKDGMWTELGVASSKDFARVLENYWRTVLTPKLSRQVREIKVVDSELSTRVQDYLKLPNDIEWAQDTLTLAKGESEETGEQLAEESPIELSLPEGPVDAASGIASTSEVLTDSLLLKIRLTLTKVDEDLLLETRRLSFQGDLLLIDLRDQGILQSFDFPLEEHSYPIQDPQALSSAIATAMARIPNAEFDRIPRVLNNVRSDRARAQLSLKGLRSLKDYYQFSTLLSQKGLTLEFNPTLKEFNGKEAQIELNYKGDPNEMTAILKSFHLSNFGEGYELRVENPERPSQFEIAPLTQSQNNTQSEKL